MPAAPTMEPTSPTLRRLTAAAVVAAALGAAAPAAATPDAGRVAEAAPAVRSYWTPERMRGAEPVSEVAPEAAAGADAPAPVLGGAPETVPPASPRAVTLISRPVPDPSASGLRMHGRVFFTIPSGEDEGDYSCSGTAVNSRTHRVVWTAGHCVFERSGGGYVTNWTFVPAYQDGAAPFGEWPARKLLATARYRTTRDLRYDFGAAVVARNSNGQALQDVVGARGIGFNRSRGQHYIALGYPVSFQFTGNKREYSCSSDEQGGDRFYSTEPRPLAITCDMTGGSSGGGWVAPGGVLLSVTSYGYPNDPFTLYGPYFGRAAKRLYNRATSKRKPKHKGGKGKGGR